MTIETTSASGGENPIARGSEYQSLSDSDVKSLAARINRPLVLVGMMGVGKSTIGRKLAQLLGLPFADADDEIVQAAQMTINEIFERYGEAYFRDGERRVIARLLEGRPAVIATGGGAFVQPDTRALIRQAALSIWLDCDVRTLVDRVTRKDTRPLLRGGDPKEIVTRLKAEREPAYSEATFKVMSDAGPHGETVNRILQGLVQWL
jgi:shikimate kinase